jgi:hypothetical protein
MSENNNTVKPSVHKLSLKVQRPQTEGYEKDENVEASLKPLTTSTNTSKPTLNLGASSYIPKSFGQNNASVNPTTENKGAANTTTNSTMNTNTPSFTPKISYNSNVSNQQPNVPINQSYPAMGQSKKNKIKLK